MTDKGCVKTGGCCGVLTVTQGSLHARGRGKSVLRSPWMLRAVPRGSVVPVLGDTPSPLCLCHSGFWPGPGLWHPREANDPKGGHSVVSP